MTQIWRTLKIGGQLSNRWDGSLSTIISMKKYDFYPKSRTPLITILTPRGTTFTFWARNSVFQDLFRPVK